MSRSGYMDDCDDNWQMIRWAGQVASACRGKRGQAFFVDLLAALDAMPEKRLIANELEADDGNVCALGALGKARRVDMSKLDPDDSQRVAETFDIAEALAREVVYQNDEAALYLRETPEQRFSRIRAWACSQIAVAQQRAAAQSRARGEAS